MSHAYAVIDVETTGLMPEMNDRIIEVAVVLLDAGGSIEWEWTSLVNPQRDLGPTRIHGITAAEVLDAPEFADLADPMLDALRGRVVVAHNASFEMRFLHHELERSGYPIVARPEALCSMKWAGRFLGPAKLQHCCEALGIELTDAHNALADARATAELISWLADHGATHDEWHTDAHRSRSFEWPVPKQSGRAPASVLRSAGTDKDAHAWLETIVSNTWVDGTDDERGYLVALDAALLDHTVSRSEGLQLIDAANACGLTPQRARELHQDHLRFLAVEAWSDGVLSNDERLGLERVVSALRLDPQDLDDALTTAEAGAHRGDHADRPTAFLSPGDRVVFTGETSRSRTAWVDAIVAVGLASGGITKSTRVLVTSDPDSMSGKAAKARSYGIPVIDETAFARLFSDYTARREATP